MQNPISKGSKWKQFFKKKNKIEVPKQQTEDKNKSQTTNQIQKSQQKIAEQTLIEQGDKKKEKNKENEGLKKQNTQKFRVQITKSKEVHQQQKKQAFIFQQQKETVIKNNKQSVSSKTKKLLSILQSKEKNQANLKPYENGIRKESKQQQKLQSTKPVAKLNRGHYKIFNPQHFIITPQQAKPSTHRWQYGTGQTPNQLLISSWNVNGIRARMNASDILPYLESVKPDIFCINEHKMDEKSYLESPYKFWGYYSYWNFPKYSLGYSGVAIFSKYPAIQMWEDIHVPQHSKEGRVITLEFDKFLLVNVYIPTCGRELQRLKYRVDEYDPAFREYILQVQHKNPTKTVIICGDINVAHKELDCHTGKRMLQGKQPAFTFQERSSFTVFLRQTKMIDTFRYFHPDARQYTWWNMRRGGRERAGETGIGKRLDYFLVDQKSLKFVKSSEIKKKVKGCDHCPIQMKIDFTP